MVAHILLKLPYCILLLGQETNTVADKADFMVNPFLSCQKAAAHHSLGVCVFQLRDFLLLPFFSPISLPVFFLSCLVSHAFPWQEGPSSATEE